MHEKKVSINHIKSNCKMQTSHCTARITVCNSQYVCYPFFLLPQKGRGWLTSSLSNWKITLGKGVLQQGGIRNEVTVSQKKVNVKQRILQFT